MLRIKSDKILNLNEYFRKDQKEAFINDYNGGKTPDYVWNNIFLRTKPMEEIRDRDCCNFVFDEIERLLRSFGAPSIGTLANRLSLLASYTDYCIDHHFSIDGQNHYREIKRDMLINYVDKKKADLVFFTEDDIFEIVDKLPSYRDKAMIYACFYGLVSDNYMDFLNLKDSDLLGDNKILISSTGEIKTIPDFIYSTFEKATEETIIKAVNGADWELVGDYVYKLTKNSKTKRTKTLITKRFSRLREPLELPTFGPKAVCRSGFCHTLKIYCEENNYDIKDVCVSEKCKEIMRNYSISFAKKWDTINLYKSYIQFLTEIKNPVSKSETNK